MARMCLGWGRGVDSGRNTGPRALGGAEVQDEIPDQTVGGGWTWVMVQVTERTLSFSV